LNFELNSAGVLYLPGVACTADWSEYLCPNKITVLSYTDQFEQDEKKMSFFDHLEELRKHLIRSAIAVVVFALAAFILKSLVFDGIILAPKNTDFLTYRFFCKLGEQYTYLRGLCIDQIGFTIANIDMTGQFMMHLTVSLYAGLILAFPYLVFELWLFIKPALHPQERKAARGMVFYVSMLFFMGVLFGYFALAPVSILFLGSYQVSAEVLNQITLRSYIGTLSTMVLAAGFIFELPMLAYFLARVGLVSSAFLKSSRRMAVVVNMIVAAIITPSDVGSMILMSIPLFLLYEISILVVKRVERRKQTALEN
jgi:sec-independent protein translocase protein TatC